MYVFSAFSIHQKQKPLENVCVVCVFCVLGVHPPLGPNHCKYKVWQPLKLKNVIKCMCFLCLLISEAKDIRTYICFLCLPSIQELHQEHLLDAKLEELLEVLALATATDFMPSLREAFRALTFGALALGFGALEIQALAFGALGFGALACGALACGALARL